MFSITLNDLLDLITVIKKSTSDPSIFMSLRADSSGAIESAATKTIYAVWMNEEELSSILTTRKLEWPEN